MNVGKHDDDFHMVALAKYLRVSTCIKTWNSDFYLYHPVHDYMVLITKWIN